MQSVPQRGKEGLHSLCEAACRSRTTAFKSGRHFLQIPGPSNVPDRVLRAIDMPTMDHRGPEFAKLGRTVLEGCQRVFQTSGPVVIFPGSGTGAWEAAIVNTLSAGDRVLMVETGQFAALWHAMAERLKLEVDFIPGDWRHGVDAAAIEERLRADTGHAIKAVMVVHNETSTGVTSRIPPVREALDRTGHPALLMVDTISSLGSVDYKHEAWGVDVTVACSQKGLMLPPGLGFNAISEKALAAGKTGGMPRSYWDWQEMLAPNAAGFFPYTPVHQPAVRAARGAGDAGGGGAGARVRAAMPATPRRRGRRCGRGGWRSCARIRAITRRC